MNQPRVAAIVPAYNEEETIGNVLGPLRRSSLVDEVLVISDGSTDDTKARAEARGAVVYQLPKRGGKGAAMLHGVAHTDAPVLLFVDADLKGLTEEHIDRLVSPVLSGSKVMNVGIRDRGALLSKLATRMPLIGGERAMLRGVIENISPEFLQGFMVESAMNYYCRSNKLAYGTVFLEDLSIRRKYEKVGWKKGVVQYFKMTFEVAKAMLTVRLARLFKQFP